MKRNRKISNRMSVNTTIATHIGVVIVFLFIMVIINILASAHCQQLSKSIGERRDELAQLEGDYNRESTKWESMKTPRDVKNALRSFGLAMSTPSAEQSVQIGANGECPADQHSVKVARRRNGTATALYRAGEQRMTGVQSKKRR